MWHEVSVIGHLGSEPEMRYAPSGTAVTNFSLATTEKWTGQDGEKHEKTIWLRISAWGKLGEISNQYLKKGSKVFVKGTLVGDEKGNPRTFEGQNGTRASFELKAATVKFLDSRGDGSGRSESQDEDSDSIPF